ncbi:hypothetical protein A0257_15120 [Hymenobacter psoromatis]|nr:hypothetical protein A0257_15120 [Hymenobacter psoromatis]
MTIGVALVKRSFDYAALRVLALAEQANISPTNFSEYFRAHAGESLQTYLTTSRLKLAEACLLHSDSSTKEIAAERGFTDTRHFSRTSKKMYGCTIQAFRQRGPSTCCEAKTTRPSPGCLARQRLVSDSRSALRRFIFQTGGFTC